MTSAARGLDCQPFYPIIEMHFCNCRFSPTMLSLPTTNFINNSSKLQFSINSFSKCAHDLMNLDNVQICARASWGRREESDFFPPIQAHGGLIDVIGRHKIYKAICTFKFSRARERSQTKPKSISRRATGSATRRSPLIKHKYRLWKSNLSLPMTNSYWGRLDVNLLSRIQLPLSVRSFTRRDVLMFRRKAAVKIAVMFLMSRRYLAAKSIFVRRGGRGEHDPSQ